MSSGLPAYERILLVNVKLRQLLIPQQPIASRVAIKLSLSEALRRAAYSRKLPIRESVKWRLTAERPFRSHEELKLAPAAQVAQKLADRSHLSAVVPPVQEEAWDADLALKLDRENPLGEQHLAQCLGRQTGLFPKLGGWDQRTVASVVVHLADLVSACWFDQVPP